MKKVLLLTLLFALITTLGFSQTDKFWTENHEIRSSIPKYKAVTRLSFPTEFKLFNLNTAALKQELYTVVDNAARHSTVITLPNADGGIEQFEVFEASNFDPALQAQFPQIRAFSGRGITDKYATLKLSICPAGIQTMVFRTEKENEFTEAYSQDHTVYAVFKSHRTPGQLPWSCSTIDQQTNADLSTAIQSTNRPMSNTGQLKTLRLAQSVTAEYSNYFGATDASGVALVLAAINATLTRCNGCYEKDLAVHLNLIANTANVIYYNAATDPYANAATGAGGVWNGQLQNTLTSVIGEANYDIGHLFGASGGGGNAGCIGCVCSNGSKGSGFTSPADNVPAGDNFDIDYVVHEVGHQLGATHSFTWQSEGGPLSTSSQREVGSGITIMGYAGITGQDVAPHSIDIFHAFSIAQIQSNLAGKTCPVTTDISANNATPVANSGGNYTIPISTPFALTGSATDANAADALTYCWEQNDASTTLTGNNSVASPTKTAGPNFISFSPTVNQTRYFPKLATILQGLFVSPTLPGGDAVAKTEALSSISRTLNFRLTVRDNCPYSSTAPVKVGQTAFADMVVTVSNTSGPFKVTQPNATGISWAGGSTQTITWAVANTTNAPVSCANVKISLSIDGGLTWPTVLVATTANDGTETVTIPSTPTTTARIVIESIGNIFFDIDDFNFTITAPPTGFTFNNVAPTTVNCGAASVPVSLASAAQGGFSTPIILSATGNPSGTSVTFLDNPLTPGSGTTMTLTNFNTVAPGTYTITVTGIAGAITQTGTVSVTVNPVPPSITTQPSPVTVCAGANAAFTVASPSAGLSYQWQLSTDGGANFNDIAGATATSYTATAVTGTDNNNQYQVIITSTCGTTTSTAAVLSVNTPASITTQPADAVVCTGNDNTFSVVATGLGLTYQWQESTTGCAGTFTDIPAATSADYTLTNVTVGQNGYAYRCVITGTCAPTSVTSNCSSITVSTAVGIVNQPTDIVACSGSDAVFTVTASGTGVNYQWQVSTDGGGTFSDIPGATATDLTLTGVTAGLSGNIYQAVLTNSTCTTPSFTAPASLTVNELPSLTAQPSGATVCAGSDAVFNSTATGTNISYQWQLSTDGGATFTDVAGATSASYTQPATTTGMNNNQYHVVVSGSCTPAAVSSNVILNVNSAAGIATQPANATACEGSDATVTVTATSGGAPAVIYQWQVSTGGPFTDIAGATSASLSLPAVTAGMNGNQYQVLVSNATCPAQATSSAVTLTVNALPDVNAVSDALNVCTGSQVQLTASGAVDYSWTPASSLNDPISATPTATPVVDPGNPGVPANIVYTVTGTGVNGCSNTASVTIAANPLLTVTLTATPSVTALLPGQSVILTANVTPTGTYTYTWLNGTTTLTNAGPTLTVNAGEIGNYSVSADGGTGFCAQSSNIIAVTDSTTHGFYIYPNPNEGQFIVDLQNQGGLPIKRNVVVYDSKGARVFTKAVVTSSELEHVHVDLRPAASDTYILVIYDGAGTMLSSDRVVVRH